MNPSRGLLILAAAMACCACAGPSAELVDASRRGDAAKVKGLLDSGVEPDSRSGAVIVPPVYYKRGDTALCAAAENDHADVVKLLLDKGAALDSKCSGFHIEPLFNPIWPATITGRGYTALLIAAFKGNTAALKALLEGRKSEAAQALADEEAHMCDNPPCYSVVMDFFIPLPGELDHVLQTAENRGHADAVRVILEETGAGDGSPILQGAVNPIVWAASAGDVALVRWLAEHGWNVNTTAQCDWGSPLGAAAAAGRTEVVDYLLKKGANPELPCDQVTPLQQANRMNQAGTARQIQSFIAHRFDDVSEAAPAAAPEPAAAPTAAPAAKTANWWEK